MLEPLGDAERQAASLLNVELDEHLRLTELAFNLIAETLVSFPDRPIADISKSFKVTVPLLNRVANDIRGASLLALCGYALQAASLVASMYEYHIVDDTLFFRNGPDTSDPAIRAAWCSLEHSLALVFLALGSVINHSCPN